MAALTTDAPEPHPETMAAGRRLLEAGDTLAIPQVETVGTRMLLTRALACARQQQASATALRLIEDLAQLLARWRPGAYSREREQAYFEVRFAHERPA
jgi:hypothetical protein